MSLKFIKYYRKFITKKLILYIISGLSSLAIDYSTFIILLFLFNAPSYIAAPLGLISGMISGFILNKYFTFKEKNTFQKNTSKQITLYIALFVFNNLFTIYFIEALKYLNILPTVSKLIATIIIVLWNYIIYKKYIFTAL